MLIGFDAYFVKQLHIFIENILCLNSPDLFHSVQFRVALFGIVNCKFKFSCFIVMRTNNIDGCKTTDFQEALTVPGCSTVLKILNFRRSSFHFLHFSIYDEKLYSSILLFVQKSRIFQLFKMTRKATGFMTD